jgi:hypothetical protein
VEGVPTQEQQILAVAVVVAKVLEEQVVLVL